MAAMKFDDIVFSVIDIDLSHSQVNERRALEFEAGRSCARQCFRKLNLPDAEVLKNRDGTPDWPDAIVGSISHSQGRAICVMSNAHKGIGVDVQFLRVVKNVHAFKKRILLANEYLLNQDQAKSDNDFALLCFSIKESVYKCLYPINKKFLHFHDVQIGLIDWQSGHFKIDNFEVMGRFFIEGDCIFCVSQTL